MEGIEGNRNSLGLGLKEEDGTDWK